ncbi:hypothetical protein [Hephaestia mangrovi]|uniref:hypothetical protein n=1 Tax=Hephaestia mangrovi TaxID=2873268 RepID=UPI001CA66E1A|nr:hypothetical protein [Hephaestia mangrovi]MBY8826821.1 hypothetical protein [Hephaestia mangrovi]
MRVIAAHAFGLSIAGIADTIGTTAGFNIGGAWLGLWLGGVLSIPWMLILGAIIWFRGRVIEDHPFLFAVLGPPLVIGSWALLGETFIREVAISSVSSSLFYLALFYGMRLLTAARQKRFR